MQFSTYIFVLAFLPLVVAGYFGANKISKNMGTLFLIAASCIFFLYSGLTSSILFGTSIAINYLISIVLRKSRSHKKIILSIGIILNVLLLLYFKYFNFFVGNINVIFQQDITFKNLILPLGISFYTFQQIAFLVDSYRSNLETCSFTEYLCFITFFPKLVMGPLMNPEEFINQLRDEKRRVFYSENVVYGIRLFIVGLFKKLIFADTFAKAVTWGFQDISVLTSADTFLVMLAYTFQIYFDFSGYSDMAMGVAKMLNFDIPMNFDSPYKSFSIQEFWKRWHMSLTNFLTHYIYIPLGGNRKGKIRTYVNILTIFLISGIWHGANWTFIIWGLLHGLASCMDRLFEEKEKKIHPAFRWIATFLLVSVLWLLFRADSVEQWFEMVKRMVSLSNTMISDGLLYVFDLPELSLVTNIPVVGYVMHMIRGFNMHFMYLISMAICLLGENSNRRTYRKTKFTVLIAALIFVWVVISMSEESIFVYNNF